MKQTQKLYILLALFVTQRACSFESKHFLILGPFEIGLFAIVHAVVGLLEAYEKEKCAGLRVEFGTRGLYYDPNLGPNWWNYYFQPINIGKDQINNRRYLNPPMGIDWQNEINQYAINTISGLPLKVQNKLRTRYKAIIDKYIKIDQSIIDKVEEFYNKNLKNCFIIGVHYRGTDKAEELKTQKLLDYDIVAQAIEQEIYKLKDTSYKIFVASDEQQFIDFMKNKWGSRIIYYEQPRSQDKRALHLTIPKNSNLSKYEIGLYALIDALLLAKSNILIRTASKLSSFSSLFNPVMRVITLNEDLWNIKQR